MSLTSTSQEAGPSAPERPRPITPEEFFEGVAVGHLEGVQGVVFAGRGGQPNDHLYCPKGEEFGPWAARKVKDRPPAYFTMAAFAPDAVGRFKGRTVNNVFAVPGFCFDLEGCPEKYGRNPDGGYPDGKRVMLAVKAFCEATGLWPNYLVLTGNGGVHLHFVLAECIAVHDWLPRARALVELARQNGLKIDAQCTTDAARIMRAPGSIHQKTSKEVTAHQWRREPYTLDGFSRLVDYVPGTDAAVDTAIASMRSGHHSNVNGDILGGHTKFSYSLAAERCLAMRQAAQHNGRDTPYPVWILAMKTAGLSTGGREFAHTISCGHSDYEEAETDKKIDSLTGGPAGCEAWVNAWGAGGPCDTCELRGKIKNPAVQLGALVDTSPPGVLAAAGAGEMGEIPQWVAGLNGRFAVVRIGSKIVIMDFATPGMTGRGVAKGMGVLDLAGFRAMLNGRFVPPEKPGDKPRPLADTWLAHPARRQYEGLVFAPGLDTPADMLNVWQGFALVSKAGDVQPWLDVLAALVPIEGERRYVLRWLAWKIQNPGGVPDTILIFKGAKGAGKNSLFDPLIALGGRHAMLADDPELIAGRFTWHLMTLILAVLDEAVFIGDPRQADRIKSRVTAKVMMYEQKGMDPVQGVNRCAYVMLTNNDYVWQATTDERRAVVVEVGETLRGNLEFWGRYHAWVSGDGPAALLHYLQGVDLTGFNPREIPKSEALRKQVEQTALRNPVAAWWHQCLTEGAIRWRDGGTDRVVHLDDAGETEVDRAALRMSYEQSAGTRGRASSDWAAGARRLSGWAGPAGIGKTRVRTGSGREWRDVLPPLYVLRSAFTEATQVEVGE